MIYILPAVISCTLGLFILKLVLKDRLPGPLLTLFLSAAVGLGTSGFLTFSSFLFFDRLIPAFVIMLNLGVLALLAFRLKITNTLSLLPLIRNFTRQDAVMLGILVTLMIPMFLFASLYPYGGWDAWGSWNTKARFLFLGETSWRSMFDPVLWRSQILYPFLLPLINVWFWSFGTTPTYTVPMTMTCVIPLLTAGILFSGLRELTGKPYMILAPVWVFSHFLVIQLSASQYSDLLVGMFLLGALLLFFMFQRSRQPAWLILMALMLGMMAFTKVEGTSLALTVFVTASWMIYTDRSLAAIRKEALMTLGGATILAALPITIYLIFYAPRESGIFINGLTSAAHPTSLERLLFVIRYTGIELTSAKWNGLWLILALGVILNGKKSWNKSLLICPVILGIYVIIFTTSYWINTFYDKVWWVTTSMNRVILAMIPAAVLWVFLSLEGDNLNPRPPQENTNKKAL